MTTKANTVINQTSDEKQQLGRAIGRIASGVFIVTVEDKGKRDGFMASWVNQASFEPAMISIAVKKERPILSALSTNTKLVVNVLSKQNMDIFKAFVKPYEAGLDRFVGIALHGDNTHGPVFTQAVSYLNCVVKNLVEAGDHQLILAEITGGGMLEASAEPMIHLRSNGFQY